MPRLDYNSPEPDAIEQRARDWLASYSHPDHKNANMVGLLAAWGRKLVREAEAREREACAKIADSTYGPWDVVLPSDKIVRIAAKQIAQAIRARGSDGK